MGKKRDHMEIVRDILFAIRTKGGSARPTHILYKSNLSYEMLTQYLNELMEKGLVEQSVEKKGVKCYNLTDRGYEFLSVYQSVRSFMDSYALSEE